MFGIGGGEMIILVLVLIIVVGPKSMPKFVKTVGKGIREVRRASSELRKQSGIDELINDDPIGVRQLSRDIQRAPAPRRPQRLEAADLEKEAPAEGVDIAHARIVLKKRAAAEAKAAKIAEAQREAELANAEPEDPDAHVGPIAREDGLGDEVRDEEDVT